MGEKTNKRFGNNCFKLYGNYFFAIEQLATIIM